MTATAATVSGPPGPPPASEAGRDGLVLRVQRTLHARPVLGPTGVLLIAVAVFSALRPDTFLATGTFSLILQQTAPIAVLALGQTLVILTAGIDLSVGAIMVLSMMISAKINAENGVPGPLALLIGLVVGLGAGSLNGFLVTRVKLPPFIVTLGTFGIFFATNLLYTESASVRGTNMSDWLLVLGDGFDVAGTRVTYGSLFMLALFAVFAYVLRDTAWGRHVYAVGDDIEASRLSGIRVGRVLFGVYAVAGVVAFLSAWVLMGRISGGDPQAGQNDNLASITAVVLGGTSLFGGRGLVLGTLVGALVISTSRVGLTLLGVDSQWQVFAVGVLVLVAVALDQWVRRLR